MALESATYINQLNSSNPPEGDPIINAADHMRLIKACLQASFPNFTGTPVTSSESQLSQGVVPTGGVIMWTGAVGSIPSGYGLCNGTTYTRSSGSGTITSPNLCDRFIIGAGSDFGVGAQGGSWTHGHTFTDNGTGLSVAQLPSHNHAGWDNGHNHPDPGHSHWVDYGATGSSIYTVAGGTSQPFSLPNSNGQTTRSVGTGIQTGYASIGIGATGSGAAHSHSGTTDASGYIPPYFALAFIMKL